MKKSYQIRIFFESLDINSRYYVYCVSGRLEELANNEQNSIYTFHGISPHDSNIFIVKSMLDMSIHKWNIIDAYKQELYYNLDKEAWQDSLKDILLQKHNLAISKIIIIRL